MGLRPAEEKQEKKLRQMFYFWGCVRLRMSSHQLQRAQGMMRDSREYRLRMSPVPVSAGINAPCHLHSLGCSHPRARPNFPRDTAALWDQQRRLAVLNIHQRCGTDWKRPLGGNAPCTALRAAVGGRRRGREEDAPEEAADALGGIDEQLQTSGTQPPGMKRRSKQTRR